MIDTDLTMKARSVAKCLTYNDDGPQAAAKHLLLEMAHRIDTTVITIHKKRDGVPIMQYPSNLIKGEDQKYLLKLLAENII
jgi:hypothetical protein